MAIGPGKYDDECTQARQTTGGSVVLIVLSGVKGHGFSCQITDPLAFAFLPKTLRETADEIERSFPVTTTA
jgi:hypothetical protein